MRGGRFLSLLSLFLALGASNGQDILLYPRDNPDQAPAQGAGGNGGAAVTPANQGGGGNGGGNNGGGNNGGGQAAASTLITVTTSSLPVEPTDSATPTTSSATSSASTATSTPVVLPLQPTLSPGTGLAGAILLLSGLIYGFWSLKNRLVHNFLSVSYAGALAVTCLIVFVESPGGSDGQQAGYIVAAILTGAVLGGLSSPFAVLTEGAGCFLGGFCFSMWIMCLKSGGLITSKAGSTIFILATTGAIGITGFLSFTRTRALTVCIPFSAATAIVLGIDCFTKAGLKEFWIYIWAINSNLFPLNTDTFPVTRPIRVETSCIMVVFLVALVVNVKFFKFLEQRKAERLEAKQRKQEELDRVEAEAGLRTEKVVSREKRLWEKKYGGNGGTSESALVSTDSLKNDSLQDNENRHSGTNTIELSDMDETTDRRVSGTGTPMNIEIVDEKAAINENSSEKPKKTKRVIKQNRPPSPPVIPLPLGVNNTIDPSQVPQPAPSRKSSKSVEKEKSVKKYGVGADLDEQPLSENGEKVPEQEDAGSERGYESSVYGMDDLSQRGFASRPNSMHSMLSMLVFNDDDPSQDGQTSYRNSMLSVHSTSRPLHSRTPSFVETRQEAQQATKPSPEKNPEESSTEKATLVEDGEQNSKENAVTPDVKEADVAEHMSSGEQMQSEQQHVEPNGGDKQTIDRDATEKEESIPPQESTTAVGKSETAEVESKDEDNTTRDDISNPGLSSKASTKRREAAKLSRQSLQQLGGQTSSRLMKVYKQHKIFEWAKESTLADQPPEEEISAPPSPGIRYETVEPDTGRKPEEVEFEEEEEEEEVVKAPEEPALNEQVNGSQPAESIAAPSVKAESLVSASESMGQQAAPLRLTPSPSPSLSRQNSAASLRQRPSRTFSSPIFGQSALHDFPIEEEPENEGSLPEKSDTLLGKREQTLKNRLSNVNFNAIPVSAFARSSVISASPVDVSGQSLEENDDMPLAARKKLLQTRRSSSRSENPHQSMTPQRSLSYGHQTDQIAPSNRNSTSSPTPYQSLTGLGSHRLSQANIVGANGTSTFDSHQPKYGEDRQTPEERAARLASWRVSLQQDPKHAQATTLTLSDIHRERMMRDKRLKSMLQRQQSVEKERLSQVIDQTMRAPDAVMLHMKRLSQIQAQAKLD